MEVRNRAFEEGEGVRSKNMMTSLKSRLLERNVYATWTRCGDKARWSHPPDLAKDFCQTFSCLARLTSSLEPKPTLFTNFDDTTHVRVVTKLFHMENQHRQ